MRVLLVNAFHYLKGGVERSYLDESRWLAAAGHEVGHFAVCDARNLPSPTARFFAPAADFGEGAPIGRQLVQLPRALWSAPALRRMEELLRTHRPDVAHVHAPSRYLTPSVLRPLERAGVPVVMTLHDFKPWCTNRILFANGETCERCLGGAHWHAVMTGCVQGSRAKSLIGSVEAYLHDALGAYRMVRLWIAPSRFVQQKAVAFGVPVDRLRVLRHGVEPAAAADVGSPTAPPSPDVPTRLAELAGQDYVLFAGRLSVEKGVRLLPALAERIGDVPLLVVGDGPLRGELDRAARARPNLRPLGHLTDAELAHLRARARVVVVPSLFYEHFCYVAAEALLDARPVVAARIGAIPELVEHEVTGLLAEPGDAAGLADGVRRALSDPEAPGWARRGRERVLGESGPAAHVEALLHIYQEAVGR